MADGSPEKVGRRSFLKGAALGGVAAAAAPLTAKAQDAGPAKPDPNAARPVRPVSNAGEAARAEGRTQSSCGADYVVDVLRALNIEHVAAVTGATVMAVHEAIVNNGMLTDPRVDYLSAMHEEAAVAMAHGYAKIEGKPMAAMMHATVGLQHGSMAIYNAYADRVPIFMLVGASNDAATRGGGEIAWQHAVFDGPALVRDFTKWDDTPNSLQAFGESAVRAYKFAMTPPYGPVLIAVDDRMAEEELPGGRPPPIPKLPIISPPSGEPGAVREVARMLVNAEHPVIFTDRMARTQEGMNLLVELAEALQAPVIDGNMRMNFPWRHPLAQQARRAQLIAQADVLLMLEATSPFDVADRAAGNRILSRMPPNSKRILISSADLFMRSNYQDFQRFPADLDLALEADAQATLPLLIEEVRKQLPDTKKAALAARGEGFAKAHHDSLERAKVTASYGWDDTPISVPRMCMEVYEQIKNEDWSLVSGTILQSFWPEQLWTADKHYRHIGAQGAAGIGYQAPASLGAALANKKHGRLSVSINGDGDFMMVGPGVLWTAAHENIPLLYVIHNNRAWHQEIMQMQTIANRRQRGVDRAHIGCAITNPNINYAGLARSLGVYAEGPIENPADLGPALKRALAVVKKGEPALVDVVAQGR